MAKDVADKATVVHVRPRRTYTDDVTGRGDVAAGTRAQGRVAAARRVTKQRVRADSRIGVASAIGSERILANGRVIAASRV